MRTVDVVSGTPRAAADERTPDPAVEKPGPLPAVVKYRSVETECEVLVYVNDVEVWCFGVIAGWRCHADRAWTARVCWAAPASTRSEPSA